MAQISDFNYDQVVSLVKIFAEDRDWTRNEISNKLELSYGCVSSIIRKNNISIKRKREVKNDIEIKQKQKEKQKERYEEKQEEKQEERQKERQKVIDRKKKPKWWVNRKKYKSDYDWIWVDGVKRCRYCPYYLFEHKHTDNCPMKGL
jgi:rubrerythrin